MCSGIGVYCGVVVVVVENATRPPHYSHFWQGAQSLAPAMRNDIWTSKSGPNMVCFVHLGLRNLLRGHNGVHFFDISTSKSGPHVVCFVHFDFEMCFAPHRRALFRYLNFQKWAGAGVFCSFWLRNVLRATTACSFFDISTSKSGPKLVLFVPFWLSKCASRHNGVHFFDISSGQMAPHPALASLLFDPPAGATNHWKKHSVLRLSYLFAHLGLLSSEAFYFVIFFLLLFSSLTLPISAFHLSILSEVWLLNFLR